MQRPLHCVILLFQNQNQNQLYSEETSFRTIFCLDDRSRRRDSWSACRWERPRLFVYEKSFLRVNWYSGLWLGLRHRGDAWWIPHRGKEGLQATACTRYVLFSFPWSLLQYFLTVCFFIYCGKITWNIMTNK
jgi:hypothetical protein